MDPVLWSIKYEPRRWQDFVGQETAITQLKTLAERGVCPNMILYGPSGTGKTAAATLFAREFLGGSFTSNFKLLNIRDLQRYTVSKAKRSMQTLAKLDREKRSELDEYMSVVYRETKTELQAGGRKREPNRSQLLQTAIRLYASTVTVAQEKVKILVLDEADALTHGMQQALRRTMEIYNNACRFILITRTLSGWSPAVVSRCTVVRFTAALPDATADLVRMIAGRENVDVDENAVGAISRESHGDLRRAIDLLQIAASGVSRVTEDTIFECSVTKLTEHVRSIVSLALAGEPIKARDEMKKLLALDGYNASEVILEIEREIMRRPLDSDTLSQVVDRLAEIDFRITQGRNPFIHLGALLASIARIAAASGN